MCRQLQCDSLLPGRSGNDAEGGQQAPEALALDFDTDDGNIKLDVSHKDLNILNP